MKKIGIVCLLLVFYSLIEAQTYIKAFTGYAFSLHPQTYKTNEIINNSRNVYVYKFKNGEGLNLGLALGYKFRGNFSFEITSNTQLFTSNQITIPQVDSRHLNNYSTSGFRGVIKYTNNTFQFAPQVVYSVDFKRINFYLKIGPNFMLNRSKYLSNYNDWSLDSTFHMYSKAIEQEINVYGKVIIGVQSSFGVSYLVTKNINLFCEFVNVNANYKFNASEMVKYNINGVDHLHDVSNRNQDLNNYSKLDFSQIGFNIGLKYIFKKRMDEKKLSPII